MCVDTSTKYKNKKYNNINNNNNNKNDVNKYHISEIKRQNSWQREANARKRTCVYLCAPRHVCVCAVSVCRGTKMKKQQRWQRQRRVVVVVRL